MKQFEKRPIADSVMIGSWEEITALPLSTITKNDDDVEKLNGIIVKGYETKFAEGTNANGERYTKDAIDDFIQSYFVDRHFNMPVDIEHDPRPEYLAGRVVYVESNKTGYYFVAYIPRTYVHFDMVRDLLREGILQGFSKMGWATDGRWVDDENGGFFEITKMEIIKMSLVSTPANGVAFEKIQEVRDGLRFVKKESIEPQEEEKKSSASFAAMFK